MALVDDSPTTRQMAHLLLTDVLLKMPQLAHNHFLEVAFLLNGCVQVRSGTIHISEHQPNIPMQRSAQQSVHMHRALPAWWPHSTVCSCHKWCHLA